MAWTEQDLKGVEDIIKNGTTDVQFSDRSLKHRPLNELQRIRVQMMQELNKARPQRRKWPTFGKGIQ